MIAGLAAELGPWTWWIVGLILLGLEILIPGVFLLWIGLAAIVVGAVSFPLWGSEIWGWQLQLLVFAVLAIAFALVGRRIAGSNTESDQPMLNRRVEGLVGRTATLEEPIAEGKGRIRLDDTTWIVQGPDMPAGARVRIIAAQAGGLTVVPA
ncbi:membrane protein implicated in regulation of membrane protease activity [Hoeflea sp. IMCC20628]|uniref:NfeD family protein n=1 Tax=Hoeflea sp. IMCC20628 TaxID=1620421 RepID=UPI00063AF333|nr:NfeD family protein [Hoeflea sp. IMCC20628]AKH99100.1 membrane protein implicated in regulation of membrane protease activity [Hoeflea sp. IMCC20628]